MTPLIGLIAIRAYGGDVAQSISWGSLQRSHLILNRPYPLDVTASSGLPVTVTLQSGPAVIANGQLTATNLGLIELRADQPGNETYQAAPPLGKQLNFTKVEFTQLAWLPQVTNAFDVSLSSDGNLALVSSGKNGVAVVDLSEPTAPQVRSVIRSAGEFAYSRRARVAGTVAYVLVNTVGLEAWNVEVPGQPILTGTIAAVSAATDLDVANGFAYLVGTRGTGLRIIDVRKPTALAEVGHLELTDIPLCVTAAGDHVLVGCYGGTLVVINVARSDQPVVAARLELGTSLLAIQSVGKTAICAAEGRWLAAVEWSEPTAPTLIGKSATWPVQDLALGDGVAFVANLEGWIDTFETVSPGRFLGEGRFPLPVQVPGVAQQDLGIARRGDLVCITGSRQGLVVARTRRGMPQYVAPTLPQSLRVDSSPVPLAVTLSSELPATVRLVEGPAELNDGTLRQIGSGTIHLRIEQAGNEQFLPLAEDYFIDVRKLEQNITWSMPATNAPLRLNEPVPLAATASSGLPTQFRVESGPAVIENGIVRATNFGRIVLVAEQPGDDHHLPIIAKRTFNKPAATTTPVGRWPRHEFTNNISAVAAHGQFALVGNRTGMQVLDISQPSDPTEIGSIGGGAVTGIEVSGQTAWLTFTREARAVDLSDPHHPVYTARLAPTNPISVVSAVGVSGHAVYLAGNDFDVFDLSDPKAPVLKASLELPGYVNAVRVVGAQAFVATSSGLHVLDVSNPLAPNLVGTSPGWNCRDVWVDGDRAFVAAGNSGLVVFDVSDPTAPRRIGWLDTAGEALGVRVAGNVALVADLAPGLQVIDVSNPALPKLRSTMDTPGLARGLALAGSSLLVADGTAGMQIVDVGIPNQPARIGGFNLGTAYAVKLTGRTAYLANGASGLEVLDISNPGEPRLIGRYDSKGTASDVEIVGTRAFLADGPAGLVVLDISDPTKPTKVGEVDTTGNASHVRVAGNRAYVADGTSGLQIIDIANPAAPRLLGRYATQGFARRVEVVGDSVYVADTSRGLLQVRVSNPASPTLVQRWPVNSPFQMSGVWAADNTVYATETYLWTQSPPGSTWARSSTPAGVDVVAQGNRAYAAAGTGGFRVIDVSDPKDTFVLGTFPLEAFAQSIRTSGDLAFVATDRAGLRIHRIREGVPQTMAFDPPAEIPLSHPIVELTGTSSGRLPVGFRLVSGPATLVDRVLTATNVGTIIVRAEQGGDSQFLPVSAERTLTASLATQTLSWGTLTNRLLALNQPYPLQVVANSGLPVSVRLIGGPAYVSEGKLVVTNRGTVAIAANQAGGSGYAPITVDQTFNLEGVAFSKIGEWPPYSRNAVDVAVAGQRAYLANAHGGMSVWNVAKPSAPKFLGAFDDLETSRAVTVSGNHAYLLGDSELSVLDVSDPASIRRRGRLSLTDSPRRIHLSGGIAYVISASGHLYTIDVTNPVAPRPVGGAFIPHLVWNAAPRSIRVEGTYAYLAAGDAGLLVLDVSRPDQLVLIGQVDTPGSANDVHLLGSIAYVADSASGLQIIDVTDRRKPALRGNLNLDGGCYQIEGAGQKAYLVSGWQFLHVASLSDPIQPMLLGQIESGGNVAALEIADGLAFLARHSEAVDVMDIGDPSALKRVARFSPFGSIQRVEVVGSTAYLADGPAGLRVLDVSDPSSPKETPAVEMGNFLGSVVVHDGLALAPTLGGGLHLLEVSASGSPTLVSTIPPPAGGPVSAEGQRVYLSESPTGLSLFDVSNRVLPRKVSQISLPSAVYDIRVSDGILYATVDGGLTIVDWQDPNSPLLRGSIEIPNARRLEVADGVALVTRDSGMAVVDVSDPDSPRIKGKLDDMTVSDALQLGNQVLIAGWDLRAFDLTNPRTPVESGSHATSGFLRNLSINGDLVFAATERRLTIFRHRFGTVQNITFNLAQRAALSAGSLALSSAADSRLPVKFTVVSGPGTLVDHQLVFSGPGEIVVRADQPGDAVFLPAGPVERTILVTADPHIRPETVKRSGPNQIEFRIVARPGQQFSVLASEDLGNWQVVSSQVATEADPLITITMSASPRFFRVRED